MVFEMPVYPLVFTADSLLHKSRACSDRPAFRIGHGGRDFEPVEPEFRERIARKLPQGLGCKASFRKFFAQPLAHACGKVRRLDPAENNDPRKSRCGSGTLRAFENSPAGAVGHLSLHFPRFDSRGDVFDRAASVQPRQVPGEKIPALVYHRKQGLRIGLVQEPKHDALSFDGCVRDFEQEVFHEKEYSISDGRLLWRAPDLHQQRLSGV